MDSSRDMDRLQLYSMSNIHDVPFHLCKYETISMYFAMQTCNKTASCPKNLVENEIHNRPDEGLLVLQDHRLLIYNERQDLLLHLYHYNSFMHPMPSNMKAGINMSIENDTKNKQCLPMIFFSFFLFFFLGLKGRVQLWCNCGTIP